MGTFYKDLTFMVPWYLLTLVGMPAATVRLDDETHYALTMALTANRETLQGLLNRAVAEYLDSQEKPTPEREEFLRAAKLFWNAAHPDVRKWLLASMQATIDSKDNT